MYDFVFRSIVEEEARIRAENEKIKVLNKVRWIRWFKLVFYKNFKSIEIENVRISKLNTQSDMQLNKLSLGFI